jgi:hypothetical protein
MSEHGVFGILMSRKVLLELLKAEFAKDPIDEDGIKLCDERMNIVLEQIIDVIVNGTGDQNKEPLGILHLK